MNAVSGGNEFKPLTIPHLKMCLNSECNTFKKSARKAVLDHHEESSLNQFFQFIHDNYEAFGMQFTDVKFSHNNAVALSFRKKNDS